MGLIPFPIKLHSIVYPTSFRAVCVGKGHKPLVGRVRVGVRGGGEALSH